MGREGVAMKLFGHETVSNPPKLQLLSLSSL